MNEQEARRYLECLGVNSDATSTSPTGRMSLTETLLASVVAVVCIVLLGLLSLLGFSGRLEKVFWQEHTARATSEDHLATSWHLAPQDESPSATLGRAWPSHGPLISLCCNGYWYWIVLAFSAGSY